MTVKEYALELLKECGCQLDCYKGPSGKEEALKDMKLYAEENAIPFTVEEIAEQLWQIGIEAAPLSVVEPYEFKQHRGDWGHWGLYAGTDCLYEEMYDELKKALESKKPFNTGSLGFKKEIEWMCIERNDKAEIVVTVGSAIDEGVDLIIDCLANGEEELLTEDIIEAITDALYLDGEYVEEYSSSDVLGSDATIEDVLKKATELIRACHSTLHESYMLCIGTTLQFIYPYKEMGELQKMLEERKDW